MARCFQVIKYSQINELFKARSGRALKKLHKGSVIKITASGRTDAGVHAKGQVIHYDSPLAITEEKWVKALHALLPEDIAVIKVEKVDPTFHARYQQKEKNIDISSADLQ